MKYGFIDFNGHVWKDLWVDEYNRLTKKINHANGQHRVTLLNQRHLFFVIIAMPEFLSSGK
jgi:hypothetical protein